MRPCSEQRWLLLALIRPKQSARPTPAILTRGGHNGSVAKTSAGILLVRIVDALPTFLLVHPGGPYWAKKDLGAWSIPKGEYVADEDAEATAVREFEEELGWACPPGERYPLGTVKQAGGKVVSAWCVIGDVDLPEVVSNTFELEWPPRSKQMQTFPEIDRAEFFSLADARVKILDGQRPFLDGATEIVRRLAAD